MSSWKRSNKSSSKRPAEVQVPQTTQGSFKPIDERVLARLEEFIADEIPFVTKESEGLVDVVQLVSESRGKICICDGDDGKALALKKPVN
jgi:hypothetical protein